MSSVTAKHKPEHEPYQCENQVILTKGRYVMTAENTHSKITREIRVVCKYFLYQLKVVMPPTNCKNYVTQSILFVKDRIKVH